jgi:hypothetical protein
LPNQYDRACLTRNGLAQANPGKIWKKLWRWGYSGRGAKSSACRIFLKFGLFSIVYRSCWFRQFLKRRLYKDRYYMAV